MGFFSKDISTMGDLFVHMLRDIYYAEQEILKALPTMIEEVTNPDLRSGLRNISRKPAIVERETVNSPAIDGIIEEADEIANDVNNKEVLDAAPRRQWNTMKSPAMAHWCRGPSNSDGGPILAVTGRLDLGSRPVFRDCAHSEIMAEFFDLRTFAMDVRFLRVKSRLRPF